MTDRLGRLRHLAARAVLLGTGDGDSLQNINTNKLNDGAICYVVELAAYYQLDKASTSTPVGNVIVAPVAGPGRWFYFGSNADSELFAVVRLTTPVTSANLTQNTWVNTPAGAGGTYLLETPDAGLWTLDTATGLLTYNGRTGSWWEAQVSASISTQNAAINDFEMVPDTGPLVGLTTDDFHSQIDSSSAVVDDPHSMTASRPFQLTNAQAVRPIFRNVTGTDNFRVHRLTMFLTRLQ